MDILNGVKSEVSFQSKVKKMSKSYQKSINISTKLFSDFCKKECDGRTIEETFNYIKHIPDDRKESILYHMLQTFINNTSETRDPTTVRNYFLIIKKLARHHGIKISNDDVREQLTFPKKHRERKYVLTLDDIHMILKESSWKRKGFYLFLLSTGMRPHEAVSIRKKHVAMLENGMFMITIPAYATKLKVEREAFVSREVYPYLTRIIRDKNEDDLIWTGQVNPDHAVITAGTTFRSCCDRIGLTQKYETVDRRKLNLYCFRGFFYAKASKQHGDEYAHKMIGHTGYLPQYDRKTIDEKISMYMEYENDLIVDQTQKQKAEISELKKKNESINELREELKNKEVEIDRKLEEYSKKISWMMDLASQQAEGINVDDEKEMIKEIFNGLKNHLNKNIK